MGMLHDYLFFGHSVPVFIVEVIQELLSVVVQHTQGQVLLYNLAVGHEPLSLDSGLVFVVVLLSQNLQFLLFHAVQGSSFVVAVHSLSSVVGLFVETVNSLLKIC